MNYEWYAKIDNVTFYNVKWRIFLRNKMLMLLGSIKIIIIIILALPFISINININANNFILKFKKLEDPFGNREMTSAYN